jgi:hypothetical protein
MGSLTDDMARLCGEIVGLRMLRRAFVQDLGRSVAQLRASFRQAQEERTAKSRTQRVRALGDLKVSVAGLRQDNLLDLEGARRAWAGLETKKARPPRPAKAPPRPKEQPGGAREPAAAPGPKAAPPREAAAQRPAAKSASRRRPAASRKKTGGRTPAKKKS